MSKRKRQCQDKPRAHQSGISGLARSVGVSVAISVGALAAYLGLGSQSSNDTIPPKVPPRSYSAPSRSSSVSISPYAHLVTLEEARTEYSKRQAYLDRIASELGVRVKYDTEGTACSAHLDALVKRFSPRSRISFRKEDMNLDLYETAVVPFTHFSVGRDDHPRVYVFRKFFSFGWIPDKKSLKVSSDDIAPAGVLVPGARYARQTDDDVRAVLFHESVHAGQASSGVKVGSITLDHQISSLLRGSDYSTFIALGEIQAYCAQLLRYGLRSGPKMNLDLWIETYSNFEEAARNVYPKRSGLSISRMPSDPRLLQAAEALRPLYLETVYRCYPPIMLDKKMPPHSK
ncbi:MAG: hypothetical protein AABX47_06710 [Nanoarchaeota archaeon]